MKKYIKPITKEIKIELTKSCMINVSGGEFDGRYDAKSDLDFDTTEENPCSGW